MFKFFIFILILMSSTVFPQTQMESKPKARMIDNFGIINIEDFEARLDSFLTELREEPLAQGYIINYGSDKEVSRNESIIRNYYSRRETIDIRILIVNGGFRASQTTELWVVPDKADFPLATREREIKAYIFSEFGKANDSEIDTKMKEFQKKLMEENNATGYIINYGNPKKVSIREKQIREKGNWRCGYDGCRLVLVNGGESEEIKTVFWIVPYGAEPPTP